jgi:ferrous iron transport protein B
MNSLYSQDSEKEETEEFSLTEKLGEAFVSIADNVKDLGEKIRDPLGFEGSEENKYLFENMRKAFNNSSAAAFAFLLFVLLYVPCLSAVAVAAREVGLVLVILQSLYSTVLGWCLAVIFYQLVEGHSVPSIVMAALILPATVFGIVFYARKSGRFE